MRAQVSDALLPRAARAIKRKRYIWVLCKAGRQRCTHYSTAINHLEIPMTFFV
jgi:hypothetical protein